jgi:capsular polysaccharide transport system permease protein
MAARATDVMSDAATKAPNVAVIELRPATSLGDIIVPDERVVPLQQSIALWLFNRIFFLCVVVLPTFFSVLYFGLIAANQYTSEARYIVRTASSTATFNPLGSMSPVSPLQTMAKAADDTNAVNEYLTSRDVVAALLKDDHLRQILSRPEADFIARFPNFYSRDDADNIYKHFQHFVEVYVEGGTGISVLRVTTFRPEDSRILTGAMLDHAEELVNTLNARARSDAIQFSMDIVSKAEERLTLVQHRITEFRNREMIIDPNKQAAATLEIITQLDGELAQQRAALAQVVAMAPDSPQIANLRERVSALEAQISQERATVVGGGNALGSKLSDYDQLFLERELAVKSLTAALTSLENARQESQRQQLYLERIVQPNRPDQPSYPRRPLIIFSVLLASLSIFFILRKCGTLIKEHHL